MTHRSVHSLFLPAIRMVSVLGLVTALWAQPPDTAPDLSRLVADLSSTDFSVRENASRQLVAAGEGVRAALLGLRDQQGIEGRLRIDAVLSQMGQKDARRPLLEQGRRISLTAKDLAFDAVLKSLSDLAGVPVRTRPGQVIPGIPQSLNLAVTDQPFFEALDGLCASGGLTFQRDYASGDILLTPGVAPKAPVSYVGPLRIAIQSLSVTRVTAFLSAPSVSGAIQLRVDVEDSARIAGLVGPTEVKEAVDDQGRSLVPESNGAGNSYLVPLSPQFQFTASVRINAPERDAKTLVRLSLELPFVVPLENIETRITDFSLTGSPGETGTGALSSRLMSLRVADDVTNVQFEVTLPAPEGSGPSTLRITPLAWVYYLDAEGRVLRPTRVQRSVSGSKNVYSAELPTAHLGEIRIEAMARYAIENVPVAFENIPLP